jgi:hypothetical protein
VGEFVRRIAFDLKHISAPIGAENAAQIGAEMAAPIGAEMAAPIGAYMFGAYRRRKEQTYRR